jgi:hypothetical protein
MSALRNKTRFRHISREFIRKLVAVSIVCIICWAIYNLVGHKLLKPIARRQIEQLTGATVRIGSIDFKSAGFVRMNYLVIGGPQVQHYENRILRANKVDVRFSLASIFRLKPRIRKVTFRDYVINAQYNMDSKRWNLALLKMAKSLKDEGALPQIEVKNGILKLTKVKNDRVTDITVIELNGELKPVQGPGRIYSFYCESRDNAADQYYFVRGIWESGPRGKLMLNGRIPQTDLPVLGNRWAINDLVLDLSYDRQRVSIHRFKWTIGSKTQVDISGTVTNYALDAEYDIEMRFKGMLVSSEPTPNALVYDRFILDRLTPGLRKFLGQYDPRGWVDIDIRSAGTVDKWAESQLAGTVTCRDISVLDRKFPYRLNHIVGTLDVTDKSVTLNDLKSKHGNVNLVISGHTERLDRQWSYDINITSSNMLLDDDLYRALNTEQKRLWFDFAPTGLAGIHYKLVCRPGGEKKTLLTVDLIDAQAVYQHFPYPLKNLTGTVYVEPGTLELKQVVSQYDGRRITLNGRITGAETDRPRYNITIEADDVPIDSTLKAALPAKQREFYESFEVDALTDVHIKVFPNEVGARLVEYIATASIKNASMIYEKFPLALTNVNVEAVLTPDLVRLESMTGKCGDSTVKVSGLLWPADEDEPESEPDFCLSVEANALELDDKWLKALPTEVAGLVTEFHPTGKVNIVANLNVGAETAACAPYKIVIECLGNGIRPDAFPYPLENVTGTITVTPENILLEDLTAIIAKNTAAESQPTAQIALDGNVVARNAEVVSGSISLHAYNVALNDALASALPEDSAGIYRAISPNGTVDLDIEDVIFYTDPNGQRWLNLVDARLVFNQCGFASGYSLTDLNAVLTADISYKLNQGLWTAKADLNADKLNIKGRLLQSLRAPITYDRERTALISNDFTADCYNGKVIGDIELNQSKGRETPYSLRLAFDDIDLGGILNANAEQQPDNYTHGLASGVFTAAGILGQKDSRIGRLNINIRDMELTRRSLLGKVLTTMQLNEPTDFIFSGMTVTGYLRKSQIIFEQVYMSGKSMVLAGNGKLDLDSNEVDLDFTASGKRITSEPSFLESLAKGLGSAVVKVEVRGDVEKPDITTTTLPLIKNPLGILGTRP